MRPGLAVVGAFSIAAALILASPLAAEGVRNVNVRGVTTQAYIDLSPRDRKCEACFATWALCRTQASDVESEGIAQACSTWFENCANGQDTCDVVKQATEVPSRGASENGREDRGAQPRRDGTGILTRERVLRKPPS